MSKVAGKKAKFSFSGVALEDEINTVGMTVNQNLPEVTALSDPGNQHVEGLTNSTFDVSGAADFAAGQGDATIFSAIGTGKKPVVFNPTGVAPANANAPHYKGDVLVSSYSITADVAGHVGYSASFQVSGAVTRATA